MKFNKLAALCVAALISAPATAGQQTDTRVSDVSVDDLDLTQTAHQQRLERRINSAVRVVCENNMRGLSATVAEQACRKRALAEARIEADTMIARAVGNDVRLAAGKKTEPSS